MEIVNTTEELYKRDSKGKIRFYRGEVGQENGKYYKRAVTGLNDGKLVESGWREVEQKNIGKVNETSLHEQALAEITADAKKKSDRGYFDNIKNVDTYDKIKPMLAGIDSSKESSKDLLWISDSFLKFLFLNAFESAGRETVPTAIPAIARLIW